MEKTKYNHQLFESLYNAKIDKIKNTLKLNYRCRNQVVERHVKWGLKKEIA